MNRLLAMAGITAEEVMAYADGVLAPDRRQAVSDAFVKYPALLQLLEIFLTPLDKPYNNLPNTPAAEALRRELQKAEPPPPPIKPLSFIDRVMLAIRGERIPNYRMTMVALAAISAVLVGATWFLSLAARQGAATPGGYEFVILDERGPVAAASLQQALDRTRSGEQASLSERVSIKPSRTYRSRQGRWCREFDLIFKIGLQAGALACRGDDGAWRVHVTAAPPGNKFTPAAEAKGPVPKQPQVKLRDEGEEILDGNKRRIERDQVVTPEREIELIDGRWKDKP